MISQVEQTNVLAFSSEFTSTAKAQSFSHILIWGIVRILCANIKNQNYNNSKTIISFKELSLSCCIFPLQHQNSTQTIS